MDIPDIAVDASAAKRVRGGGRVARREQRSHGSDGLGRPFILRKHTDLRHPVGRKPPQD